MPGVPPRRVSLYCLIASLILVSSCFTLYSDTIYLKNGKKIDCASAREEGNVVKYTIPGGNISIPKSMVIRIEKGPIPEGAVEIPKTFQEAPKSPSADPATIQHLEEQKKTNPAARSQLAGFYTNAGVASAHKQDFDAALDYFEKAYDLVKDETTAGNLAKIHYVLKDDWNAEQHFQEVLKWNPKDAEALYYLGEIAWREEKLEDAMSYWQRSYEISGDPELKEKLDRLVREKKVSDTYQGDISRHFLLKYDGGNADPNLVREISDFLEETYQQLSNQFETYPSTPFVVVLYPRETYLNVTDMPSWSGGANDGKIKLPVKGLNSVNKEMKAVLTHELTHSFVRIKASNNYPTWLQEGLAQYSEGKRLDEEETQVLAKLIQTDQLPHMERLSGTFLGASTQVASILYLQSLSFTKYLIDHYPFYQMNELLEELGKGSNYSQAFEAAYGVSIEDIEQKWRDEFTDTLSSN